MIAAVNFGRDNGSPIAIRGGAHNGPGLVIDLSAMRGVRVDPQPAPRTPHGCARRLPAGGSALASGGSDCVGRVKMLMAAIPKFGG